VSSLSQPNAPLQGMTVDRMLDAQEAVATRRAKERLRALNLSGGEADLPPLGEAMREIRLDSGEALSDGPDVAPNAMDIDMQEELRLQRASGEERIGENEATLRQLEAEAESWLGARGS